MALPEEKPRRSSRLRTSAKLKRRTVEIPRGWSKLHKELRRGRPSPKPNFSVESVLQRMHGLLEELSKKSLRKNERNPLKQAAKVALKAAEPSTDLHKKERLRLWRKHRYGPLGQILALRSPQSRDRMAGYERQHGTGKHSFDRRLRKILRKSGERV